MRSDKNSRFIVNVYKVDNIYFCKIINNVQIQI